MLYPIISLTWVFIFGHLVPSLKWDHGIYASVAERLVAGDQLYSQVWDNKDPLFYWTLALGRRISPAMDFAIEIVWLLIACIAASSICSTINLTRNTRSLFAYAITPLVVTGGIYMPGLSHLPGIAVTLAVIATAMRNRLLVTGALLATLIVTKVVMLPIAGLATIVILARPALRKSVQSNVVHLLAGFMTACGFWALVLLMRGELGAWLHALKLNFSYSSSGAGATSRTDFAGPIVGHFLQTMSVSALIVLVAVSFLIVFLRFDLHNKFAQKSLTSDQVLLWQLVVTTLISSLTVILLTGIWTHHAQVYYIPAVLIGILLASRIDNSAQQLQSKNLLALFGAGLLLGGVIHVEQYVRADLQIAQNISALSDVQPLTAELRKQSTSGSYARAGSNDDSGHAYGLRDWKLACPRFTQYSFDDPELLATDVDCLSKADYLLLSLGTSIRNETPVKPSSAFEQFIADLHALVKSSYKCTQYPTGDVCEKTKS